MTSLRPLLVRPGARYQCFGDGLCCTDVHAMGPLTPQERERLAHAGEGLEVYNEELGGHMLATSEDGRCLQLDPDGRCRIQHAAGGLLKPRTCHRYPMGLTATPRGGRITLEYHCPCQSILADAPAIEVSAAHEMLLDGSGRLEASFHVGDTIDMRGDRSVSFDAYEAIEQELQVRLRAQEDPREVIDREPFCRVESIEWVMLGRGMVAGEITSRFDAALRFFGDAVLEAHGVASRVGGADPWKSAFDRAETRGGSDTPQTMLAEWVADKLWALHWADHASFEQFLRGLSTRIDIAERIAKRRAEVTSPRRAWAEAIMIVDLVGASAWWEGTEHHFVE